MAAWRGVGAEPRFGIGSISKSLTTALVGTLTDKEALAIIWNDPVVVEPGTRGLYGTGTYTIIAAVIERAGGQDFLSAMNQQVIGPLGLEATVPNERRKVIPQRTCFYERAAAGEIAHAPYFDPSFKWAGAGYLSTAEDLSRFGVAMSGPGLLSEPTWKEIIMPARTTDGKTIEFALGWDAPRDLGENGMAIGKSGGGPGITGYLAIYPERELVIAVLTNLSRAPVLGEMWDTIESAFLEERALGSRDV